MEQERQSAALERIAFFSDAVFAIAMTLLVIELRAPRGIADGNIALVNGLLALVPNVIGFLVGFAVVARFWLGHHRYLGMLARPPRHLAEVNLLLLFTIVVMPFPTAVLSDYAQRPAAVMVYAGWLMVTGLANLAVMRVVLGNRALFHHDVTEAEVVLARRNRWIPIITGGAAIAGALVSPLLGTALLILLAPLLGALLRQRLPRG